MKKYIPKKPHKWGFKMFILGGHQGIYVEENRASRKGYSTRFWFKCKWSLCDQKLLTKLEIFIKTIGPPLLVFLYILQPVVHLVHKYRPANPARKISSTQHTSSRIWRLLKYSVIIYSFSFLPFMLAVQPLLLFFPT